MDGRLFLRWLLSPIIIGGTMVVAAILLGITLFLLWLVRPGPAPGVPGTAVLNVIPMSTFTPIPPTITPVPEPTVTSLVPPPPSPGSFSVGSSVQITGTGGDGLRLRADPGLQGDVRFLALEGEVFQVEDGPQEQDGYTWWFLVAPYDATVKGWAVSNYLAPVQNP